MSNDKKAVKAGTGYIIGNYCIKGLSFLTIPIFARLLSTTDYGIYNIYCAYESIVCILIGLALYSSFKNANYIFKDKFNQYVSSCVLLAILNLIAWIIVANLFYNFYSGKIELSRSIINILLIQGFCSSIISFYNVYISIDYQYKNFLKIAFINAISNVVLSVVLILFVFKEKAYSGRIIGTALPVFFIGMYIIFYFWRKAYPVYNKNYWSYAVKYSFPIVPHGLSQIVLSQFDRIMINAMIGASESGIYSFAYNIYTIVSVTASSLDNTWSPWFYEKMNEKKDLEIRKVGNLYALVMLIFSAAVVLVAPEIIMILGTKEYTDSVYCVIPLVIAGYFAFLYTLPVQVEYYYEKTKIIAIGTIMAGLVNIILNFIFIEKFGYIAAAYNTAVTYFIYFLFHYILSWRIAGREIFSIRILLLYSLIIIAVGGISIAFISNMFIRWFIAIIMVVTASALAEKKFGIITKITDKFRR